MINSQWRQKLGLQQETVQFHQEFDLLWALFIIVVNLIGDHVIIYQPPLAMHVCKAAINVLL